MNDFESNTNFYPDHVRMQILEFYRNTLVLRLKEAKQINEDYSNGHDRVDELVDKAHYRAEEAEHKALHATRLQHASEAKMQYLQERVKHLEAWYEEGGVMLIGYDAYRNMSTGVHIKGKGCAAHSRCCSRLDP